MSSREVAKKLKDIDIVVSNGHAKEGGEYFKTRHNTNAVRRIYKIAEFDIFIF